MGMGGNKNGDVGENGNGNEMRRKIPREWEGTIRVIPEAAAIMAICFRRHV